MNFLMLHCASLFDSTEWPSTIAGQLVLQAIHREEWEFVVTGINCGLIQLGRSHMKTGFDLPDALQIAVRHYALLKDMGMVRYIFGICGMAPNWVGPRRYTWHNGRDLSIEYREYENASGLINRGNQGGMLHSAVLSGDLPRIKEILGMGVAITSFDSEGLTPLHTAVLSSHHQIIRFLLREGHNVDIRNRKPEQDTPLLWAIRSAVSDSIRILLEHGADINAQDNDGRTSMMLAIDRGNLGAAKELLAAGVDPIQHSFLDTLELQPQLLVSMKVLPVMMELINAGADVNTKHTSSGRALLHHAAAAGNATFVSYLLKHGSVVDVPEYKTMGTPLAYAVRRNHIECVRILLHAGADRSIKLENNVTLAHLAADLTNGKLMQILLEKPMEIDACDSTGLTPLCVAIQSGNTDCVRVLLDAGANRNTVLKGSWVGWTPAHFAASCKDGNIMINMLEKTLEINVQTEAEGWTPLCIAIQRGNTDCVRILLDAGANRNTVLKGSSAGWTPAHFAASCEDVNIMINMLEKPLEINVQTEAEGWTPLYMTLTDRLTLVARLLIEAGADNTLKTREGWTVLDQALALGYEGIVELFPKPKVPKTKKHFAPRLSISFRSRKTENESIASDRSPEAHKS
jgi:ankyrin repeat protein